MPDEVVGVSIGAGTTAGRRAPRHVLKSLRIELELTGDESLTALQAAQEVDPRKGR